jgi:hypothetical protein
MESSLQLLESTLKINKNQKKSINDNKLMINYQFIGEIVDLEGSIKKGIILKLKIPQLERLQGLHHDSILTYMDSL